MDEDKKVERPSIVTEVHLSYLDALRDSGITNMFGASMYVEKHFKISKEEASTILVYWMRSFGERNKKGDFDV